MLTLSTLYDIGSYLPFDHAILGYSTLSVSSMSHMLLSKASCNYSLSQAIVGS